MEEAGRGSDEFPNSSDKLSAAGIRLVQAYSNDPDGVGFVRWRAAWHVAGEDGDSVLDVLALWEDLMVIGCKATAKDVGVHIYPHTGFGCLEQSKIEETNHEHYRLHAPADERDLPLKWSEAAPCTQPLLLVLACARKRGICVHMSYFVDATCDTFAACRQAREIVESVTCDMSKLVATLPDISNIQSEGNGICGHMSYAYRTHVGPGYFLTRLIPTDGYRQARRDVPSREVVRRRGVEVLLARQHLGIPRCDSPIWHQRLPCSIQLCTVNVLVCMHVCTQ